MFPLEIEKDTGRETVWKGRLPTTAKRIRREHPSWTVKRVRQACIEEIGDVPSLLTFQRFLGDSGLTWKQLTAKPLLSAKNIQKRIEFAGLHQDWTVEDWGRVWWSDETTIQAIPQGKKIHIWIQSSSDQEIPTAPAVQKGSFSVTFWGAVSKNAIGPLVPLNGNLDGPKCKELLEDNFMDILHDSGDSAIFMQDNAPCHKHALVMDYLREERVNLLEWPAQSPDLNPIENLWAILKRRITSNFEFPRNRKELIRFAQQCWNELEETIVDNTLDSMPKRMKLVIEAGGKSIKY